MPTDCELYREFFRAGDMDAFDELICRYNESLTWYLYGLLHDYQDAEDMMVEAFAKIIEKKPRIEGGAGSFKAYLFMTGRNLTINLMKHVRRHEELNMDGIDAAVSSWNLPENINISEEQKDILYRCLGRIEPELREVLCLVFFDDLSYREAAEVLKVNTKKIDYMLRCGKDRMRDELKKEGVTDPFI